MVTRAKWSSGDGENWLILEIFLEVEPIGFLERSQVNSAGKKQE